MLVKNRAFSALVRRFHTSRIRLGIEEHEDVREMMESGAAPVDNRTEKRPYAIPKSLLASWRQQRRFAGSSIEGKFKDVAVVKVRSGDGGDGKISFLREAGRSVGPPDGGDGGGGGHVYIQASPQVSTLSHIRHIYSAQNGRTGGSTQITGKRGDNVVLHVPVGTQIRYAPPIQELREFVDSDENNGEGPVLEVDIVTNYTRFENDSAIQLKRESFADGYGGWKFKEQEEEKWMANPHFKKVAQRVRHFDLIHRRQERNNDIFPFQGIDLNKPGEQILLVSGGAGGLGNMHFQSPELRSPSFAKQGRSGCELTLIMELKMLADLGLVGLPNAGKSTLLRAISRAQPRVGDYEFTTLTPSIGTINLGIDGTSFSVADIPGIIKDAHLDKGLGLGFLRHVERCKGLAFVIALDRPDPIADLELLLDELGAARLGDKNVLVVATKADMEETESKYHELADYVQARKWDIIPCCAKTGSVEGVIQRMAKAADVYKQ